MICFSGKCRKTSLPLPEDVSTLYRTLARRGRNEHPAPVHQRQPFRTFMVSLLAEDFEDMKIHVFDSKTLSCGLGLLVLEAAESLQNGMSVEDTIALLEKRREHQLGAFVIRTLEFLRKGGRIGRVEGAIGSLLQIKLAIYVNDEGVYNTLCKARGFSNALTAMVDEIIRRYQGHKAVVHGAAYDDAVKLRDRLMEWLTWYRASSARSVPHWRFTPGRGCLRDCTAGGIRGKT